MLPGVARFRCSGDASCGKQRMSLRAVHAVMAGAVDTQATGPAQYVAFCRAALTIP